MFAGKFQLRSTSSVTTIQVGHVFRDDHPYDFGSKGANNVFIKNNNRFVHTWMDDYKGETFTYKFLG